MITMDQVGATNNGKPIKAVVFDYGRTLYDRDNSDFFPETSDVLEYLYPKYILSIVSIATEKDPPENRIRALKEKDFLKYFRHTLFHSSDKDHLFAYLLNQLDVNPDEVAVVDDRVFRGIAWGNKHGAMTVWLRGGKFADELPNSKTGEPSYTIENLLSLKDLL